MQQDEKAHSIADLGVFVIAPLLNELDYKYSVLDENTICAIIKEIIKESYNSEVSEDLNLWRETNELYYHNIIEILPVNAPSK